MDNFPASGRPAPGAQLTNPNSQTPFKNSQTPVKKLIPTGRDPSSQVFSHRARPPLPDETNPLKTGKNLSPSVLTDPEVKVYIPGRDTNKCPEELERAEMLDFLLGILIPLKLLLLVWFAWQLLHWLL